MKTIKARIQELEKRLAMNPVPPAPAGEHGGEGSRGGKVVGHLKSGDPIYESHSGDHAKEMHPKWNAKKHEEAVHFHSAKAGEQVHPMRMGEPGAKEKYQYHHNQAGHHVVAKWDRQMEHAKKNPKPRPFEKHTKENQFPPLK
jgi:hypothetical protein